MLCFREGFISGCPDGTPATHTLRASVDKTDHPVCAACALDLAAGLGPVVIAAIAIDPPGTP